MAALIDESSHNTMVATAVATTLPDESSRNTMVATRPVASAQRRRRRKIQFLRTMQSLPYRQPMTRALKTKICLALPEFLSGILGSNANDVFRDIISLRSGTWVHLQAIATLFVDDPSPYHPGEKFAKASRDDERYLHRLFEEELEPDMPVVKATLYAPGDCVDASVAYAEEIEPESEEDRWVMC
jgi:hypothetical protein